MEIKRIGDGNIASNTEQDLSWYWQTRSTRLEVSQGYQT